MDRFEHGGAPKKVSKIMASLYHILIVFLTGLLLLRFTGKKITCQAASPSPTIIGVFSVPGRLPNSCPPPWNNGVN